MFQSKLKLVLHPDDRLRKVCEPVETITKDIFRVGTQMMSFMKRAGGIGLAAPQVGILHDIVALDTTEVDVGGFKGVMINPKVIESSGEFLYLEGCLSIPGIGIWVKRKDDIIVSYQDLKGEKIQQKFRGITAVAIQHELDHLVGVLMVDKPDIEAHKKAAK